MVRLEHHRGIFTCTNRLGDANTNVTVDTANKKVQIYVNGSLVQEWS